MWLFDSVGYNRDSEGMRSSVNPQIPRAQQGTRRTNRHTGTHRKHSLQVFGGGGKGMSVERERDGGRRVGVIEKEGQGRKVRENPKGRWEEREIEGGKERKGKQEEREGKKSRREEREEKKQREKERKTERKKK